MIVFQPTPPARGATFVDGPPSGDPHVSTHAPRAGGDEDYQRLLVAKAKGVSTHAPRAGGDRSSSTSTRTTSRFNPRPPRGGRPPAKIGEMAAWAFQPTPPARGATAAGGRPRRR